MAASPTKTILFKSLKVGVTELREREKVRVQRSKDRQWVGNKNSRIRDHVESNILPVVTSL